MTDSVQRHEPSPEFREFLEWQVATTLRREARFAQPVRRTRYWMNTVVLVFVSVTLGAAAAVGTAQMTDARQRDALVELAKGAEAVAALSLQFARDALARAQAQFDAGVASRATVQRAEVELRDMEAKYQRAQLNVAEIRASGAAPRDELSAPPVNGRDFVSERLKLDVQALAEKLAAAEREAADVAQRVAAGAAHRLAADEAQLELTKLQSQMSVLMRTLELRQQFLQEKLVAAQVSTEQERIGLRSRLEVVEQQRALQSARLGLLEQRLGVGQVAEVEVLRARLELEEALLEIRSIVARLAALNRTP